jgi:hypothetical protein
MDAEMGVLSTDASTGSRTVNADPTPSALSTEMCPP